MSGVFLSTWTHWAVTAGPSLCSTKHADSIDLELEVDPLNVDHFSCTPLVRGRSLVPTLLLQARPPRGPSRTRDVYPSYFATMMFRGPVEGASEDQAAAAECSLFGTRR